MGTISEKEVIDKLLVSSLIVLLHDTEVSHRSAYKWKKGLEHV